MKQGLLETVLDATQVVVRPTQIHDVYRRVTRGYGESPGTTVGLDWELTLWPQTGRTAV